LPQVEIIAIDVFVSVAFEDAVMDIRLAAASNRNGFDARQGGEGRLGFLSPGGSSGTSGSGDCRSAQPRSKARGFKTLLSGESPMTL
jgi:hypothetical protein